MVLFENAAIKNYFKIYFFKK